MSRYLITGGAGFIGSHLAEFLIDKGEEVVIVDNFSTGRIENLENIKDKIELHEGDIRDKTVLENALKEIDRVIHLAAISSVIQSIEDPVKVSENNILGTVSLFDAIAKSTNIRRIVQASSSAVYGDTEIMPIDESCLYKPMSPYAIDKVAQELYGDFFSNLYDIDIVSLRFFNVYGTRQDPKSTYAGVIPIFIDRGRRGEELTVFGDGSALRDFINVKDIVRGLYISSISELKGHHKINLGTGKGTNIRELAEIIGSLTGKGSKIVYKDKRIGEIDYSLADIKAARDQLGFRTEISLNEGLEEMI